MNRAEDRPEPADDPPEGSGQPEPNIDRTIPGLPVEEPTHPRRPDALPSRLEPLGPLGKHPWMVVPHGDLPFIPYCTVCSLKALTSDGEAYAYGSGVMIGRRTVLTARHCVLIEDAAHGGPARWIEVFPGRGYAGGDILAYTPLSSSQYRCDPTHDFAVIFLGQEPVADRNVRPGPLRARMLYAYYPNVPTGQVIVHNLGYPGVHPATPYDQPAYKSMWKGIGQIVNFDGDSLDYDIDTTVGNSGSPIFLRLTNGNPREDDYHILGIHVEDFSRKGFNRAVRVSPTVCDQLDRWRRENGDTV